MKIVLTGSLGNIGRPLTENLVKNGFDVTVISSNPERQQTIESIGAKAAIGSIYDAGFLTEAFKGAGIVYLMETMEAAGDMFDPELDFVSSIVRVGENYKEAIEASGVKQVIHLSSIGAHMEKGNGILVFHYLVEQLLRQLPDDITIKFMRPVGFYINLFSFVNSIKEKRAIFSNYGGNKKEPWVSPLDIADVIAEEAGKPFSGRTVRYIASDEVSPDMIAKALGEAIGMPELQWKVIPDEELLKSWINIGFNVQVAKGFIEMQAAQRSGVLYEDYYRNQPVLGKVKLADFAKEFANVYSGSH
ncbi:NAD(P)H-binding protein [Pseudobacter ginsenosidimutans]|uniref:Uncharacterized protein YbjT (DUF2867 family) n=1 Tax=Pseudobacter ginsenosidimutans TaxID=661488 RepID=A0A4Q7N2P3_9BACT|nr:NAD(P)H-binding protein [Pseudobacter ginsenosidimutans]QEC43790.1 NAD-dependent epimerase/dehydratase family protein [Pseudobacter ginsenosidimutans]RZS75209.1 uncharacterized protein YbjT (DUF2867 family) [Pseudobacter ginsenosidimutans]